MASHVDGNAVLQGTPATSSAFTPAQVEHYLRHISFPLPPTHPRDAFFLETLHRCQITSIPYENLSLHYNPAHSNSIDPQHLYAKFLPDFARALPERTDNSSRGRGGFCFETCVFFLYILRGLGFAAYPTAAHIRIRDHFTRVPSGPFVGPRHVVNVVLLEDGSTWSCDVGFGGDGPTSPLQLRQPIPPDQEPEAVTNLGAQEVRLRKGVFPGTVRPGANPVWFYEYRNRSDAPWNTYYAFGEAEASLWDLECANWWVASHPDSFQRKQLLVVKFLGSSDHEEGDETEFSGQQSRGGQSHCPALGNRETPGKGSREVAVIGKIMLADGVLKRNMGGKTELVKVCQTEKARLEVLKEYFGIYLTEDERQGIRGFETELGEV